MSHPQYGTSLLNQYYPQILLQPSTNGMCARSPLQTPTLQSKKKFWLVDIMSSGLRVESWKDCSVSKVKMKKYFMPLQQDSIHHVYQSMLERTRRQNSILDCKDPLWSYVYVYVYVCLLLPRTKHLFSAEIEFWFSFTFYIDSDACLSFQTYRLDVGAASRLDFFSPFVTVKVGKGVGR